MNQELIQQQAFANLKFDIATIQFNYLAMNSAGTHIEANPATHIIAEYIVQLTNEKDKRIAELSALLLQREGEIKKLKDDLKPDPWDDLGKHHNTGY